MILGGVVMTFLVNLLLSYLGNWAVDTFYNADDAVEARNRALAEDLQRYVTQQHVSSTDFAGIVAWFDSGIDADLIIYEDDGGATESEDGKRRACASGATRSSRSALPTAAAASPLPTARTCASEQRVKLVMMVLSFLVFVGDACCTRAGSRGISGLSRRTLPPSAAARRSMWTKSAASGS